MERLQKIISQTGFCSRRQAETLIKNDLIKVNGQIAKLGDKADLNFDKIEIKGQLLSLKEFKYYLVYKPKGYLSTLADPFGGKNLTTLIKQTGIKERVFPVGRLDKDSEGLMILTNDGEFANKIMHPRYNIEKTYLVTTNKTFLPLDGEKLKRGIVIDRKKTWPAKIKLFKEKNKTVEITIHEGRKRIIRRMLDRLGYQVISLKRIKIGDLSLANLKPKQIREISREEIEKYISIN